MSTSKVGTEKSPLIKFSANLLTEMYSENKHLFSSSTKEKNNNYLHEYKKSEAIRYSINSLLGIKRFEEVYDQVLSIGSFADLLSDFNEKHRQSIKNLADRGLYLILIADDNEKLTKKWLKKLEESCNKKNLESANLQECAWLLWGLSYTANVGYKKAHELADTVYEVIKNHYRDPGTGIPRYKVALYRNRFSSFGGLVYYLRSLYEYCQITEKSEPINLFQETLEKLLLLQGPRGEWPWFYSTRQESVLDYYPIYSVHQDSMAFLFLFPALEMGYAVEDTVEKTFGWILGKNQINEPMVEQESFIIYRALNRKSGNKFVDRIKRYLRALKNEFIGSSAHLEHNNKVEIVSECRSYHPGWVLYVWSGVSNFEAFQYADIFR